MFNNYRLPKEAPSDPTPAGVVDNSSAEKTTGSSTTADTNNTNVSQGSKWFPTATNTPNASNAPPASSSSIANALMHPSTMGQGGVGHLADPVAAASSVSGLADRREDANTVSSGTREVSAIPHAQIPDFILSTIYSLFSRPSAGRLPLPRDVLSTYRTHLGHLVGSHSMAYSILKTFWLPCSPVLFRLVWPRTLSASKPAHRNSSASQTGATSSLNTNFASHANQPAVNGDSHSTNRASHEAENYDSNRFFYWDPFHLSLGGPLNCPICRDAALTHLGPIRTGPLRVFDLPSSTAPSASAHANAGLVPAAFFVIGMQYRCSKQTCGKMFNSWDPRIVNNLPQVLADEWPVYLPSVSEAEQSDSRGAGWSGDAVSRPLFTLTKTLFQAGTSEAGVRDVLAKLWNWNDSEREEEPDEDETLADTMEVTATNSDSDKVAAVEAVCVPNSLCSWSDLFRSLCRHLQVLIKGSGLKCHRVMKRTILSALHW
jgi:hypothetical protein